MDIINFCKQLGSTAPTPGGGAAAGIVLSLAAGCTEKSIRFSKGEKIKDFLKTVVEIRKIGFILAEKDEKAFLGWQQARKLPKDSDKEKKIRTEKINKFITECIITPLSICENAVLLAETIKIFLPNCNKWLISDAGIGAIMSDAAFKSGIYNIDINLPYLKNDKLLLKINNFKKEKINYLKKTIEEIIHECENQLK